MKHKHCDLIKAWADGAEIQFKSTTDRYSLTVWIDVTGDPAWMPSVEYRIKPKKKQLWARSYALPSGNIALLWDFSEKALAENQNSADWVGPAVLVWEE